MSLRTELRADKIGNLAIQKALDLGVPIEKGASAGAVRWLERMLKQNGFNVGKLDNLFSANTEKALRQFQAAWNLPVTGKLDKATFAKLKHTQTRIRSNQKHDNSTKVDAFGVGQRSSQVLASEKRLKALGYDVGKVDGVHDLKLNEAVKRFRNDQRELPNGTGVLSQNAMKSLRRETAALNHDPYRVRALENHKHRKQLDAMTAKRAAAKDANGQVGFGEGAQGKHVKVVQERLRHAGFDPKHTNGRFDERTEAALRAFQKQAGIPVTGRVTPQTWKHLQRTFIYAKDSFSPPQREGEKSAAVLRTEKLLRKLGYKRVKADGLFDARTESAVKAFEKRHGLERNGIVSEANYKKMKRVLEARQNRVRWGGGWGGSERMGDVAKRIAREMGLPVTSTKRTAAGSIGSTTGSDHHVSQRNAYAVDIGVAGPRGTTLAKKLAKAYGLKPPYIGTYRPHYLRIDGRTYRVQLLWQVSGHFDHVHIGFRRVA